MTKYILSIAVGLLIASMPATAKSESGTTEESLNTEQRITIGYAAAGKTTEDENSKKSSALRNTAKLNLSSLAFKTISLQYERNLLPKMSVALGFRMTPSSHLPFSNTIINQVEHFSGEEMDEDMLTILNTTKTGGWAITPEFRYYLGKRTGRGLYLAPFLRYGQMNVRSTFLLIDDQDNSETVSIPFEAKASAFGAGLMLGWQFRLHKRVTLDWWMIGPYYTSNTLKLSASNLNLSTQDQQDIRDIADDIEISLLKVNSEVTANAVHLNVKGNLGAIRSFGLCLGLRF